MVNAPNKICQSCKGEDGIESVTIFGTNFIVCAYCRGETKDIIDSTYIWRKQRKFEKDPLDFGYGYAIVLN